MPNVSAHLFKEPVALKLAQVEFMKALRLLNQMANSPYETYLSFDEALDVPAPQSFEVVMPVGLNLLPELYRHTTGLIIRNHFRKAEVFFGAPKAKSKAAREAIDKDYSQTLKLITQYLDYIENYSPLAWDYLLTHQHGQRLMMFLMMTASMHQTPELPLPKIRHIAAVMVKKLDNQITSTPRRVEDLVLVWALEFLFLARSTPGNIFAVFLQQLGDLHFTRDVDEFATSLQRLLALPIPFEAMSDVLKDYFLLSFRLMILRSLNSKTRYPDVVFNAARILSKPVFGEAALFDSHETGYQINTTFINEIKQFELSYSRAITDTSSIKTWIEEVQITQVMLQDALAASEDVLSRAVLKQMLLGWFTLVKSSGLTKLFDSNEKKQRFWETPLVLLNKVHPKQDELFELVADGLDDIIFGLLDSQHYIAAYHLLSEYTSYSDTKSKKVQALAQQCKPLASFFWLFISAPCVPELPVATSVLRAKPRALDDFLREMKGHQDALQAFGPTSLPERCVLLQADLVKTLLQQYIPFFAQVKPFLKSREYKEPLLKVFELVNHVLQVLNATRPDFERLDQAFGYTEYLYAFFQKPGKKPPQSTKRKKENVRAEPVAIEKEEERPKVEQDYRARLPSELLALAALMREQFGENLVLFGGAAASLYFDKTTNIHDYDCLIMDVPLEAIQAKLQEVALPHTPARIQIIGKAHPVLSILYPSATSTTPTEIQIASFESKGRPRTQALIKQLRSSDFKTTTLYLELKNPPEPLKMEGLKGSFKAIQKGEINSTSRQARMFYDDAVRLLRLVKIRLKYPALKLSPALEELLATVDKTRCFSHFYGQSTLNQGRIGSTLMNMLERFEPTALIQELNAYHMLEGMTGIDESVLSEALPILVKTLEKTPHSYEKKLWFYLWLATAYCLTHPPELTLKGWPFYKVARHVLPEHLAFYEHVTKRIWNNKVDVFVNHPALDAMIDAMSDVYHANAASLSASP